MRACRHYEIEGVLYPASDWASWAAVDKNGEVGEFQDLPRIFDGDDFWQTSGTRGHLDFIGTGFNTWDLSAYKATTELDRYCLKMYGSMFDKIDTNKQRILENLHNKGGLAV